MARCDEGAISTEYALLAAFIAVVAAVGIAALGAIALGLFESANVDVPW